MKANNIQVTFGALPIFACGALIVPHYTNRIDSSALRRMLGEDAAQLDRALAQNRVAIVRSARTDANYDLVVGVAEGRFEHLEQALNMAEAARCRSICLPAFGVYELTAEAMHVFANANDEDCQLERAHRLYARAVSATPETVARLGNADSPLMRFASEIGHVQFIDVVATITGCNEISPSFQSLNR